MKEVFVASHSIPGVPPYVDPASNSYQGSQSDEVVPEVDVGGHHIPLGTSMVSQLPGLMPWADGIAERDVPILRTLRTDCHPLIIVDPGRILSFGRLGEPVFLP